MNRELENVRIDMNQEINKYKTISINYEDHINHIYDNLTSKIFESIDNESITNKSTVFFKFSNKYTEVLFSKPDVNIISYSSRAALTKVINPYADDDKFNKSTYIINSDFVKKIRSYWVN